MLQLIKSLVPMHIASYLAWDPDREFDIEKRWRCWLHFGVSGCNSVGLSLANRGHLVFSIL